MILGRDSPLKLDTLKLDTLKVLVRADETLLFGELPWREGTG